MIIPCLHHFGILQYLQQIQIKNYFYQFEICNYFHQNFLISISYIDKLRFNPLLFFLFNNKFILILEITMKCFHSNQSLNPKVIFIDHYLLKFRRLLSTDLLIPHFLSISRHRLQLYFLHPMIHLFNYSH